MKAKELHHIKKTEDLKPEEEETTIEEKSESFEDQDQSKEGSSSSVKNMVELSEEDDHDKNPFKDEESDNGDQEERSTAHTVEEVETPNEEDDFDDQNLDELSRRPTSGMNPSRPKSFTLDDKSDNNSKFASVNQRLNSQISSGGLYTKDRPRRSNGLKFLLLLIVGVLVIAGSIYILKGKASFNRLLSRISPSATPAATPLEEATTAPTPSPTPALDRSLFTIRVLNGTSTTGLASSVSAKLKALGYNMAKTGNATNSAFTQTVVLVKDHNASLSAQLIQDLSPDFTATSSGTLKASDTADGEVILGAK